MPSDLLCLCVSMIMMKCELILWLWSPSLVLGWLMLQSAGKNCAKACYSATQKLSVLFCTRIRARGRWRSFSIEQQTREAIGFGAFFWMTHVSYCHILHIGWLWILLLITCGERYCKFENGSRYLKLASKVLSCLSTGCYLLLIANSTVYNQHNEW